MTLLPYDSLVFKLAGEDMIPCDGGSVSFELAGEAAGLVDPEIVRNAAAAVLHYFRHELKRTSISASEFAGALEMALRGLGLTHLKAAPCPEAEKGKLMETDLVALVGDGLEMIFFQRLREELRRLLGLSPQVVRFHGLRPCVMQLAGARRWSPRCQTLRDQIVEYLRSSLCAEPVGSGPCGLVVH